MQTLQKNRTNCPICIRIADQALQTNTKFSLVSLGVRNCVQLLNRKSMAASEIPLAFTEDNINPTSSRFVGLATGEFNFGYLECSPHDSRLGRELSVG